MIFAQARPAVGRSSVGHSSRVAVCRPSAQTLLICRLSQTVIGSTETENEAPLVRYLHSEGIKFYEIK